MLAAEHGQHDGDLMEFLSAVERYRMVNGTPFPTSSEIYQIVLYLGYRKVAEPSRSVLDVGGPVERKVQPYRHPATMSVERIRELMNTPTAKEQR